MDWRAFDSASECKLSPPAMLSGQLYAARTAVLCHRDMLLIASRTYEARSMSDNTLILCQLLLHACRKKEDHCHNRRKLHRLTFHKQRLRSAEGSKSETNADYGPVGDNIERPF